jgi:putative intracellular protease/amidase
MTKSGLTAAVLLYEGCTITEVAEMATRLTNLGVRVEFVARSLGELRDQSGLRMLPDRALADLDPTELAAVVVPGGDTDSVIENSEVLGWLQRGTEAGVLVAAICAGVALVAAAGVTMGRRITHNYRSPWAPPDLIRVVEHLWVGASVEEDRTVGVVRDRNLITALPNAPVDFAMEVLVALGLYDRPRAGMVARHLKGGFVDELYALG